MNPLSRSTPRATDSVREVQPLSLSEWETEADRWDACCFFQTPQWVEALCEAFPQYKNRSVILHGHSGPSVLLPLVENRKAFGLSSLLSLPHGTYGGPIPQQGSQDFRWDLVECFLQSHPSNSLTITLPPGVTLIEVEGIQTDTITTQLIDLTVGYETVHRQFRKSCREAIRKAERNQVEVSLVDKNSYFRSFLELYRQNLKRWGRREGYPQQLFDRLWATPEVQFWGALIDGKPAVMVVTLTHQKYQYAWVGVMDEEMQKYRPNNLLYDRIIEQGCREGNTTFDFGNSDGMPGVFSFKEAFGCNVSELVQLLYFHPLIRGYHRFNQILKRGVRSR